MMKESSHCSHVTTFPVSSVEGVKPDGSGWLLCPVPGHGWASQRRRGWIEPFLPVAVILCFETCTSSTKLPHCDSLSCPGKSLVTLCFVSCVWDLGSCGGKSTYLALKLNIRLNYTTNVLITLCEQEIELSVQVFTLFLIGFRITYSKQEALLLK